MDSIQHAPLGVEPCRHGIRHPWPCDDCLDADIPAGKSLHDHPCYGIFSTAPTEFAHRSYITTGEPMFCERCGTELDTDKKQKAGAQLSWQPLPQSPAPLGVDVTDADREELVARAIDPDRWPMIDDWSRWRGTANYDDRIDDIRERSLVRARAAIGVLAAQSPAPNTTAQGDEALEALKLVEEAMLRGGDGKILGYGWNITKLNAARPAIFAALKSGERQAMSPYEKFQSLNREEQSAFLAFFAGARVSLIAMYRMADMTLYNTPSFGKAECELVPFHETWRDKFPALGLTTYEESKPYLLPGAIPGHVATTIIITVTEQGWQAREDYSSGLREETKP